MNQKNIIKILILVALSISLVSTGLFAVNLSRPDYYIHHNSIPIGSEKSLFNYIVNLHPSTIYNETRLANIDYVYRKIADKIEVSYNYELNMRDPGDIKVSYSVVSELIVPNKFNKTLSSTEVKKVSTHGNNVNFTIDNLVIDVENYENIIKEIEEETGLNIRDYTIKISVNARYVYNNENHNILDNSESYLSLNILKTSELGDIIKFDKNDLNRTIYVSYNNRVYTDKLDKSYLYGGILVTSLTGFLGLSIIYNKRYGGIRIITRNRDIKKKLRKYHDALVKIHSDSMINDPRLKQIKLMNLEDLVKISDILVKPIYMYEDDSTIKLMVIDDERLYCYEAVKNEKKEK